MTYRESEAAEILKRLSKQDFLNFGMQQVAYIRPVQLQDKTAFMVHAADGTPISVLDSEDTAILLLKQNELEPITVH
jgi:hypothetical protein